MGDRDTLNRSCIFGVKFAPGFDMELMRRQAGCNRYAYNLLLETFQKEYGGQGWVNCTRGRIGEWFTMLRRDTPFLQNVASRITRDKLFELGRHYNQYVETEWLKAAGEKPPTEFGEPRFKRYGDEISIPLVISHDKSVGSARFIDKHKRILRIVKLGDIHLSRTFPIPNYRPKTATLYQTPDMKWRISISCDTPKPPIPAPQAAPQVIGIDCNVGNVATPDCIIMIPERVVRRRDNLERTIRYTQRVMSRRQAPNHKAKTSGSNRYERSRIRHARRQRELANLGKNATYKVANVIRKTGATHGIMENLKIKNMTKSAKGTKQKPGKHVRQKSGLNRSILRQNWGLLRMILSYSKRRKFSEFQSVLERAYHAHHTRWMGCEISENFWCLLYMIIGGVIRVDPHHTSQMCSWCGHTDKNSRHGRLFRCVSCGFIRHADRNAALNIENRGRLKLHLKPRLPVIAGSAQAYSVWTWRVPPVISLAVCAW